MSEWVKALSFVSDGSGGYTDSHYGKGISLNGIADFAQIKQEK